MKQLFASLTLMLGLLVTMTAHASQSYKVIVQPINGTPGSTASGVISEGNYLNFGTFGPKDMLPSYMYIKMKNHVGSNKPYLDIVPNTHELTRLDNYESDDHQSHVQIPTVNFRYNDYAFNVDERSRNQTLKVRFPESQVDNVRITVIKLDNDKH